MEADADNSVTLTWLVPGQRLLADIVVHDRHPDVIVVGRSLGSSLAIQLAAEESVARLVLIAPFESMLTIAKQVPPFLPTDLLLRDTYKSWKYAPRITTF